MSFPVIRRLSLILVLGAASVTPISAEQEDPDSVVQLSPVLVRVLGSAIQTQSPTPVSVVAGSELTRANGGAFLEEALRAVPGVQIQNRFNFGVGERLAVRGFGSRAQFGVRGIRVLVDGIPATLPDGQATLDHLDLAGLGRVEALRGPGASLYGNGAGGVIHFRTLEPASVPAAASFRTTAGSHGLMNYQGNVTGTSGDIGYRVGFSRLSFDNFRPQSSEAPDGDMYGAVTKNVFNSTVTLPAGNGSMRLVANVLDFDAENAGSMNRTDLDAGHRAARFFNRKSNAHKDGRQFQGGTAWTGMMGDSDVEIASWIVRRELDNPIPGRVIDLNRNAGGVRALINRTREVDTGAISFGFGAETEFQRDDRQNYQNDYNFSDGGRGSLILDQFEKVRGVGLFAQGRLDHESGLSLLGGLRYDNINFSVDDRFQAAGNPDDSGSRAMDALSPSVGVLLGSADNIQFFSNVSKSFETPTTTELANQPTGAGGFNSTLNPQAGWTVEGGLRTEIASRWAAEGSIFRTKITDGLVPFTVPDDPGRDFYQNAGEISHTGWEVALDGSLVEVASMRVAYTRIDARFDQFVDGDGDYSGNKVPGLAPNRIDALLLFESGPTFLEIRTLYQDAVPVDDEGRYSSDSYKLVDARFGLDSFSLGQGNFEVSPFFAVANLFDEFYTASVIPNAWGGRYFEPGPGRTFRIGMGVTLGS